MVSHALHRTCEIIECFDVSDSAEQTGHHVERASKIACGHVCLVQDYTRVPLVGDGEHLLIKIESLNCEMLCEMGEVQAGATRHIQ